MNRSSSQSILVGVDGGGTYSRALCTDLTGAVVAYVEGLGTNPYYVEAAHDNFRSLIKDLLEKARRRPQDIAGLSAGLAGLDSPADTEWAIAMTSLPGMACTPVCVNDAIVAHAGALGLNPGILVIAGTGSITVGINERGEIIRNYDFNHYAPAAARFLVHEALFQLLTRDLDATDQPFLDAALSYWQVDSLAGLRDIARQYPSLDKEAKVRRYGRMGPLLTQAAAEGGPLACRVCDWGASQIADSICLVRTCFEGGEIPVAIIGAVGRSGYIYAAIKSALNERMRQKCVVVEPKLPPAYGAALLAAKNLGIGGLEGFQRRLAATMPAA